MKKIVIISLLITFLVSPLLAFAVVMPHYCAEEELVASSDFAIEGYVVSIEHISYLPGDCVKGVEGWILAEPISRPIPGEDWEVFSEPTVYAKKLATIKVTKNIKGNFNTGDKTRINFSVFRGCEKGYYYGEGLKTRDFPLYAKIRYYHNTGCYNDIEIIKLGAFMPIIDAEKEKTEEVIEEINLMYYLVFAVVLFLVLLIIFLKKRKIKDSRLVE